MKSKIKQIIPIVLLLAIFCGFHFAQAALVNCGTTEKNTPCGFGDLVGTVFRVINFLLGSATLLAIGYILFGGVRMIIAVGNEDHIKNAKTTIRNAIVGLFIIIMSYLIITSVTSYFTGHSFQDLSQNFFHF